MPCRLPVDLHTFQGIYYTKGRYFLWKEFLLVRKLDLKYLKEINLHVSTVDAWLQM